MNKDTNSTAKSVGRREFMRDLAIFSCGTIILGNYGFIISDINTDGKVKAIVIDFSKCTGCRTCETVRSAFNYPLVNKGIKMMGPGNPYKANIQVYHYNPDIDVPSVCSLCPDNPCIKACPVEPDKSTGRKALYKDQATSSVRVDSKRCIACGKCTEACSSKRTGVIRQNSETGEPMGICTLCDGDPKCVKYCTYGTLSYIDVTKDRDYFGLPPQKIAQMLYEKIYMKSN